MSSASEVMPTVGEIARRLGEPIHRVEYVLRTRDIRPSGLAGNARVYDEAAVRRVEAELRRIRADRQPRADENAPLGQEGAP